MSAREQGRYVVLFLMAAIFFIMLGICISKWNEKKVGETQSTKSASEMFYPSVTLIPWYGVNTSLAKWSSYNNSKNLTEYHATTSRIQSDIISIEQSYETSNGTEYITLNESSYSSHPNLFTVDFAPDITNLVFMGINDSLQELVTYNPAGPTKPGFLNMLQFELSTKDIISWEIHLHDRNHFTISSILLYGKEMIYGESSLVSGTWAEYQVEPVEVNQVQQDDAPCEVESDNVKNMWDCLKAHNLKGMGCTLPWSSESNGPFCSSPQEYDSFHTGALAGLYQGTKYIYEVAKCTPGCKRVEYSAKLYKSVPRPGMQDRWQVAIYFAKDRFPVKEQFLIYDNATFLSDFGAYLGLLLGYSILTFYEMFFDLVEYIGRKCNKKERESKRPKSGIEQVKRINEKSGVKEVETDNGI